MSELATTIRDVLRNKPRDVFSTRPDATVYEAIELMAEKQIGALPVIENGQVTGLISERDYARKIILKGRSSKDTAVSEIMTSPVISVSPRETVGECMRIVTENRVRHLPVLEGGRMIGMISIGDLVNWIITEQQATIRHLEAYISGS
jgi:CBS domain-containing protein